MAILTTARSAARFDVRLLATTSLGALALAMAAPGLAQAAAASPPAEAEALEEIVVTGTLIRGVAPVGTNVTGVNAADIQRSGATSTNQILSQIPEITNAFNIIPVTPAGLGRSTFRPDLRNLGATGGASTLVLMDGHNLVGAGILQTTPDAGAIPPGAIERVEVVADGGSSIYGADAIGGIVNFITRNRFQGFEVSGHHGWADGYKAWDLNMTTGASWSRGSAVVAVMARQNDELSAADRDFPRQDLRPYGGTDFRVRTCPVGTVIANGTTYALPSRVAGTVNLCDTSLNAVVAPKERQYGAYASITQELADNLEFQVKAFASERKTKVRATQISNGAALINNTNPFFQPIGAETQHSVAFDYSSVLGPYFYNTSQLSQWHVTPTLTYRLANEWRIQGLFDYGWSDTEIHAPGINSIAEAAALRGAGLTTQTALNPYNPALSNPSVVYNIGNWENYARSRQQLGTWRVTGDGPLFSAPGGQARLAVGAQYQKNEVDALSVNAPRGVEFGAVRASSDRNIKSVYGQLVVPVVGADNAMSFVRSFDLDGSVRHDDYSDFGGTTNFKLGASWEIAEGFKLRGNYGTAFQAPSLADSTAAVDTRANIVATTNNIRVGDPASDRNRPTIQMAGGNPNLGPQNADTWSVGFDFQPERLSGLSVSGTFWSVTIKDVIGIVPAGNPEFYTLPTYSSFYILRPTLQQALAVVGNQLVQGAANIQALYGAGNDPYILTFQTRQNLGTLWVEGIDGRVNYDHRTDWGRWYVTLTGTRHVKRKTEAVPGAPIANQLLAGRPKFQGTATVGAEVGKFSGYARVNYTSAFDVVGVVGQTRVKDFHPLNLYLAYQLDTNFDLTLNIDNVFDSKAPFVNLSGGTPNLAGFQINSTLGRFVNVGVRKRF